MSWLKTLFGGKPQADAAEAEEYKGCRITPSPIADGGQFRVAARIEKDGRVHELMRADTCASRDEAVGISLRKARQVIDEQGDALFRD